MKHIILTLLVLTWATASQAADLELTFRSRVETAKGSGKFEAVTKTALGTRIKRRWWSAICGIATGARRPRAGCRNGPADEPGRFKTPRPGRADHPLPRRDDGLLRRSFGPQGGPGGAAAQPLQRRTPAIPAGRFPIDDSDGGCSDEHPCPQGIVWTREIATLEIKLSDGISDKGGEVYNLMRQKAVENVIVMGVHTNM